MRDDRGERKREGQLAGEEGEEGEVEERRGEKEMRGSSAIRDKHDRFRPTRNAVYLPSFF